MSFGVLDGDGQVAQIEGHPFGRISFTGTRFAQADVRLLSILQNIHWRSQWYWQKSVRSKLRMKYCI